jgi:hypothetical protein
MDDQWSRLLGSPVLRATTPSIVSSMALDVASIADLEHAAEADSATSINDGGGPGVLDSFVHLHEIPFADPTFGYAYFRRDVGFADVQTPSGHVVANALPVVPRCVRCDAVHWSPVLAHDGSSGHRFDLCLDGVLQAHVEVFTDAHQILRIAFVHASYSLAAKTAGVLDDAALLEFATPVAHIEKLHALVGTLSRSSVYLPTSELALGPALDPSKGVPMRPHARHAANPLASIASVVWQHAKRHAAALSTVAVNASVAHNEQELRRTGLG